MIVIIYWYHIELLVYTLGDETYTLRPNINLKRQSQVRNHHPHLQPNQIMQFPDQTSAEKVTQRHIMQFHLRMTQFGYESVAPRGHTLQMFTNMEYLHPGGLKAGI